MDLTTRERGTKRDKLGEDMRLGVTYEINLDLGRRVRRKHRIERDARGVTWD